MINIFKKEAPEKIVQFVNEFVDSIRIKNIQKLRSCFREDCIFTFDYSKFGKGIETQDISETLEKTLQLPDKMKLKSKIVSYHSENDEIVVTLKCIDQFPTSLKAPSYLKYFEELKLIEVEKNFVIKALKCTYIKIK